jgi:hypothetical protein
MTLPAEPATVYHLSETDFLALLERSNKTGQRSLKAQLEFEKLVVSRGLSFADNYFFKNARQKVSLIDSSGELYEISPYAFKAIKSTINRKTAAKKEFEKLVDTTGWTLGVDYEYKNTSTKVPLVCSVGHACSISPSKFKSGQRCAVCAGNVKYDTESFITRAKEIHGNKYDYSVTRYGANNKTQVEIICSIHGVFRQTPSDHINQKSGCQKCKFDKLQMLATKTHDQFIKDALAVHGERYCYDKTSYELSSKEITITCLMHGDFKQLPSVHLTGSGCQQCANEDLAIKFRKTTAEFITEASDIHQNRYDYSLVNYQTAHDKVKIICGKHGAFEQSAGGHLQGAGCNQCAIDGRADKQRKSRDKFIEEAKHVHGDHYDYSLTEYKNIDTPVDIICSVHGIFSQAPYSHLIGSGCIQCGFENTKFKQTKSTNEFVEQAVAIHGKAYDYSLVKYTGAKELVQIICSVHGVFEQQPSVHLTGAGCRACGFERSNKAKTMTQSEFISKANEIHGSKYDYSNAVYELSHVKVDIICPEHGVFSQTANSHLNGNGCPRCAFVTAAERQRLTTAEFIELAVEMHGETFDYSEVDYVSSHDKVKITCPIHGVFEQTPTSHLTSDFGCRECANKSKGLAQRKTTDEFISVAKEVHGDRYDYSLTEYVTAKDKVAILCHEHGLFMQDPRIHINGSHCPKCNYGKGVGTYDEYYFQRNPEERNKPCNGYYVKFKRGAEVRYKVGLDSTGNRWKANYKGWDVEFLLRQTMTKYDAWLWESALLEQHQVHRYKVKDSEFIGNGSTEMFHVDILKLDL